MANKTGFFFSQLSDPDTCNARDGSPPKVCKHLLKTFCFLAAPVDPMTTLGQAIALCG